MRPPSRWSPRPPATGWQLAGAIANRWNHPVIDRLSNLTSPLNSQSLSSSSLWCSIPRIYPPTHARVPADTLPRSRLPAIRTWHVPTDTRYLCGRGEPRSTNKNIVDVLQRPDSCQC